MILVDMNQVTISNLMIQIKNEPLSVDLVRHLVLNSIRSYRSKFCNEFGEVILCYDDKHYWRRDLFPYYKSNRKKDRTESSLDWNELFETLNLIRDELKETFPYKVLQVDGAEADDIIATLVSVVSKTPKLFEKILILSGDKDFIQLQSYDNVQQYSPTLKKFINVIANFKFIVVCYQPVLGNTPKWRDQIILLVCFLAFFHKVDILEFLRIM